LGSLGHWGWLFIGGYAVAAMLLALAIVGAGALLKRLWRNAGGDDA